MATDSILLRALVDTVQPLTEDSPDLDALVERLSSAQFVLLGEASHGTHEFYELRAAISRRLLGDYGFAAIAAEADWPDAHRVNRFIRHEGHDRDVKTALSDFQRFPQWMWRNSDVVNLVTWMRTYNRDSDTPVGFYGLDMYSLHSSINAVIDYLAERDENAAIAARARYACFDTLALQPDRYGMLAARGLREDCADEVVAQLIDLQKRREQLLKEGGTASADQLFAAEQNARVVAHAEEYYRAMYRGQVSTWNLRDTHMMETLDALSNHLGRNGKPGKIIVWAHNSHVGDAEATEREFRGEINLGQLCRQRHPKTTKLVGFTTHHGSVTAASDWGAAAERKIVRPALTSSYEHLFHDTGIPRFVLHLDQLGEAAGALHEPRLHRAIGVVYRPQTERESHYYHSSLPSQFDAIIHVDESSALLPLERSAEWDRGELPDTYPSGL
ncbi:MAG TPA: erythromycin esterase family protein [Kofleriaceae bacterium]|jgi:erythromycin esterase-like protein